MTVLPPAQDDVPLGPLTTFGVGGPARKLFDVDTVSGLQAVLAWARTAGWPTLLLGDGSNVLVADGGYPGAVIRFVAPRIVFQPDGETMRVWADAGVSWDRLVDEAVARDAAGVECLTGIPGRVGAAPIQNIGAYGQELAETTVAVEAVERSTGRAVVFSRSDCGFGYRTSRFKRERDRWVVTRVHLRLRSGGPPTLKYQDLVRRADSLDRVDLRSVRDLVRSIRAEKSMLRQAGDENFHSAGSFFTNPIVAEAEADRVETLARDRTDRPLPRFPAGLRGKVKLSAAWLIEQSGFPKGWRSGRAGLSTRHTLALVNRGGATAAELMSAAVEVRDGVLSTFGVHLTPEPVLVGAEWPPA